MLRFPAYRLFMLLIFVAAPVCAQRDRDTYNVGPQSFEISGQVRIAETNEAAQRVQVRVERFTGGTIDQMATDTHGRFRFTNLPRGYYRVVINTPNFRPTQQDADLQVLFKAFLVFDLVPQNSRQLVAPAIIDVIDARAPAEAREELIRGREALSKKGYEKAVAHLQKAIAVYPEFYEANLLLGTAFVDERDWGKAESAFQRAVDLKTDSPAAVLALGEVYWRQKRYDEAEKTLLEGLKLDEKSWHGYFTLGRLYWDQGNIPKAGGAIGHTLQLKPDFAEGHLLAGNILLRVKQQERALAEYQEYLRLSPKGEFAQQTRELVDKLNKAIVENKK